MVDALVPKVKFVVGVLTLPQTKLIVLGKVELVTVAWTLKLGLPYVSVIPNDIFEAVPATRGIIPLASELG